MGIDHWIENGYGDRDRYEEGLSVRNNPDRVVARMSLPCLRGCGTRIIETHYADGHREFEDFGIVSTPDGVRHHVCPTLADAAQLRLEDLLHDADTEHNGQLTDD